MAEQEKKAPESEAPGNAKAVGREKARARGSAPGRETGTAGELSALDLQRFHVALEQARFERERAMQERCGEAMASIGALHAEVSEKLSERGAELQQEMMELWRKMQAHQTQLWQAGCGTAAMEAAAMREAREDLARTQLRMQALQAMLCNLAVLDPEASAVWFDGVTREADIRSAYESDVAKLDEGHADTISALFSEIEAAEMRPAMRMQVETLRSWYARN